MAVTLEVCFPWGRMHATPWGRHTNEGAVEWPPSPRRILRALYACWMTRHPELDGSTVEGLLDRLAVPPVYGTDEIRRGFTRHYLAADGHTAANYDRDLAIDAFVSCRPDRGLLVHWDVDLTDDEQHALEILAASVPYLGRADSICEVQVTEASLDERPIHWAPLGHDNDSPTELIDLHVPTSPLDLDALTESPAEMRSAKRLVPAGVQTVTYAARHQGDEAPPKAARPRRHVTAVRYLLDGRAPVHPHQSVALAHLLRSAAISQHKEPSAMLSGRDEEGARLDLEHRHAHYLVYNAADPIEGVELDTAVVWAPGGFGDTEIRALTRLRRLSSGYLKDVPTQWLMVEGVGDVDTVAPELIGPARRWRSATPFVITRFPKDGRPLDAHLVEQVGTELQRRGLPEASIQIDSNYDQGERRPWWKFRRHRPNGSSQRNARPARHVRIEFEAPQRGPIVIGAMAHFSLGLLVPDDGR